MNGEESPDPSGWCGWMGGEPDPDGSCAAHKPAAVLLPAGLVIARSQRVVSSADLAAENEAFADATGPGSFAG